MSAGPNGPCPYLGELSVTDGTTTYSCDTLVAGLVLQSTPVDWWCLYWIHRDTNPSVYNGVDVLLPCGEAELDSSWGDDLHDGKGASPFVVKLLHGVIRGVILEA